jgi:hypothetical protein
MAGLMPAGSPFSMWSAEQEIKPQAKKIKKDRFIMDLIMFEPVWAEISVFSGKVFQTSRLMNSASLCIY